MIEPAFTPKKSVALSGVPAGNTALCSVGRSGNDLHYRGYDILDLAAHCEFEEVAHLLVHGHLPTFAELAAYKTKLRSLRGLPSAVRTVLKALPAGTHPMDVLRTGVSALGCAEPEREAHGEAGARIVIETQESGKRIIDKTGPLANPADRDHCLQYMVAVALLKGTLTAEDYEDAMAADPRLDALRANMEVFENADYTRDYLDSQKRSIGNAVQVFFRDGTTTGRIAVEYPIGHSRRRAEALPVLLSKFENALRTHLAAKADAILALCGDAPQLGATPVHAFMALFTA